MVDAYAKRLQIQEKMTAQICNTINEVLQPRGTAVVIEAAHQCMTTRGVHKRGVTMVTSSLLGAFRDDSATRRELMAMFKGGGLDGNVTVMVSKGIAFGGVKGQSPFRLHQFLTRGFAP